MAPAPLAETQVYAYVSYLRTQAVPTSGSSFIEAVGFARSMIGLGGTEAVLASKRICGAAAALYVTKKPPRQATA